MEPKTGIGTETDCQPRGRARLTRLAALVLITAVPSGILADIGLRARQDVTAGRAPAALALLEGKHRAVVIANDAGLVVLRPEKDRMVLSNEIRSVPFAKSVAAADLTGGPEPDLACIDGSSPTVFVLARRGARGFAAPREIRLPSRPVLLKGDASGQRVWVIHETGISLLLREKGEPQVVPIFDLPLASDLDVGDVNGDGTTDLVVAQKNEHRVVLLAGRGGHSFREPRSLGAVQSPQRVLIVPADTNGASPRILVLGATGVTSLSYDWRPRAGERPGGGELLWAGSPLGDVAAADLDSDGRLDVAVTDRGRGTVSFLMGREDGGFALGDSYGTGRHPGAILLADLDRDGRTDALTLNLLGDSATYLHARADGFFEGSLALLADARDISAVAVADFDGDGNLDLATTSAESGTLILFMGDGRGRFFARPPVRVAGQPRALVASYFGSDPVPDLAVADFAADEIVILLGDGRGGFRERTTLGVESGPVAVVAGQFRKDGYVDLAVANSLSNSVSLLLGDGSGRFDEVRNVPVGPHPNFLLIGDINRNGHADLVVGNDRSESVVVFPGSSDGLGAPQSDRMADRVRPLLADDLDHDGRVDLVALDSETDSVRVLPATGAKSFGIPLVFPVGRHPHSAATGDFDGDGLIDLAVVHPEARVVSILINATAFADRRQAPRRAAKP